MSETEASEAKAADGSKSDWNAPKPAAIPRSTYFPAAMAFGLTLFFWGFVTSPVLLGMGLVVTAGSLAGWVREIWHE